MQPDLAGTFAALGDPTRLEAVRLLVEQPRRSSDIAEALGVSRATMSRHLRALAKAGVLAVREVEDDGRGRLYALRPDRFEELRAFLAEVEAFWTDQLAGFKAHAEAIGREPR